MAKSTSDSVAKPDTTKKVFDISHPGKTTPSATSRPVIVTNRPIMKDPMMSEGSAPTDSSEAPKEEQALSHTASKIKITPLSVADSNDKPTEEPPKEPADTAATSKDEPAPVDETPTSEEVGATPDEPEAAETTDDADSVKQADEAPAEAPEAASTEAATQPAPDDTPAKGEDPAKQALDTEAAEAEAKKQADRQAELEKVIDSQKYALPINTVKKRRITRTLLVSILVIVVLGVASADLAMDAGVLHVNGVKPVTHFFKK
ncbi:MAG TPA: hypothetical protein VHD60_00190 [Candidatus Saccharimonadales bacterium]|nr:hypothetical protein [Candidatus Saccharimonadales bacterium]